MRRHYYIYILASDTRVLYVGVTNSLLLRTLQHKSQAHASFTSRYHIVKLVYFETFIDIRVAIAREKVIKRYTRARKFRLIEQHNPDWRDLSVDWYKELRPSGRSQSGGRKAPGGR